MESFRKEKMGEAIRKVVCEKLLRDGFLARSMVTINRVHVSPDYGLAKIFYSIFGEELDEKSASSLMHEQSPQFRHEISKKLNLRRTPKIEFCLDKNTKHAFRIEGLLRNR